LIGNLTGKKIYDSVKYTKLKRLEGAKTLLFIPHNEMNIT